MDKNKTLLPIGTLLHNQVYRIEKHLASGGFGNTYLVTNVEFNEKVAIKEFFLKGISGREGDTLTVTATTDEGREQFGAQREKFKKEARLLRKINHPNIVRVHDLFDENGTSYYAMDWIDGESLGSRLKRTGKPLSEKETRTILEQVLDALETIHSQGIWHLDLKPANIMLDKQGKVVLIDFGASKQFSSVEGYTSLSGFLPYTPGYAASEQMEGTRSNLGPWTDFYALGATLYYLLTCQAPPSLSDLGDEAFVLPNYISQQMQDLIAWMMTLARKRRPQSVADIRLFLQPKNEDTQTERPVPPPSPKPEPEPQPKPKPTTTPGPSFRKYGVWLLYVLIFAIAAGCCTFGIHTCNGGQPEDSIYCDTIPSDATDTLKEDSTDEHHEELIIKPEPKPISLERIKTEIHDLGYATWEGPMNNGRPNGDGVMIFKSTHHIGGGVDIDVSAGDYIEGYFENGFLSSGTLHKESTGEVMKY